MAKTESVHDSPSLLKYLADLLAISRARSDWPLLHEKGLEPACGHCKVRYRDAQLALAPNIDIETSGSFLSMLP